jgi:hypothetical protein
LATELVVTTSDDGASPKPQRAAGERNIAGAEHSIPGVERLRYSITFRNILERPGRGRLPR